MNNQEILKTLRGLSLSYDLILLVAGEEVKNLLDPPFDFLNEVFRDLLLEEHLYFYSNGIEVFPEWNIFHTFPEKKLGIIQKGPTDHIQQRTNAKLKKLVNTGISVLIIGNLEVEDRNIECMSELQIIKKN